MTRIDYYPVRVAPQAELAVGKILERCGLPTLVPIEYKWRPKNAQTTHTVKKPYPLLPRYVIVGLNCFDDWYKARAQTSLIQGFVSFDGVPKPVPPADLAWLQSIVERGRATARSAGMPSIHRAIALGETAEIVEGPYMGHVVKVDGIDRQTARGILKTLNGWHVVSVPVSSLKAV
jgi:transcription antitermination factor NusG